MICPYCTHAFPLTWRRYASSPLGRQTCPGCNHTAKLKSGPLYWLLYVPFLLILPFALLFLALLAYAFAHPTTLGEDLVWLFRSPWFFAVFIVWAVVFPVDKVFDGRFRKLEKA